MKSFPYFPLKEWSEMSARVWIRIGLMTWLALTGNAAVFAQGTATPSPEDVNIAAEKNGGQIIYASSEYDENWKAKNLIDGTVYQYDSATKKEKGSNGWASKSWNLVEPSLNPSGSNLGVSRKPEEVIIGFKDNQAKPIGRVVINPETVDDLFIGRGVRLFEVQVSTNSPLGPWRSIGKAEVPQKPDVTGNFNYSYNIIPAVQARYVKILFIANWGSDKYVSCGEIEIYPPGADAPTISGMGFPSPLMPGGGGSFSAADLLKFFMDMKPEERNRFIQDLERLLNALKGGSSTNGAQTPPKEPEKASGGGK
jgi:hypothetical protein